MRPSDRFGIWWGLSLFGKWEVLGVWLRMRCSACGGWYWNDDPCFADGHVKRGSLVIEEDEDPRALAIWWWWVLATAFVACWLAAVMLFVGWMLVGQRW